MQLAGLPGYRGLDVTTRSTPAHPLAMPKPSLAGHEPHFHRPFEPPPTAAVNGYDRHLSEHERLVKEREKMLDEHRHAQEKAQKLGEKRGSAAAADRNHERSGGGSDVKANSDAAHRAYVSAHDPKAGHYASSSHTSQSRRSLLPNSKAPVYGNDKHHAVASSSSKPPSLEMTQSALSSLQSFSQSASALSSLSSMIHSDHMLSRYDSGVGDKLKDRSAAGAGRLNGVHASAGAASSRPRPATAAEPLDRRKRVHSGDASHKHKHSPRKQSRSSSSAHAKKDKNTPSHHHPGMTAVSAYGYMYTGRYCQRRICIILASED